LGVLEKHKLSGYATSLAHHNFIALSIMSQQIALEDRTRGMFDDICLTKELRTVSDTEEEKEEEEPELEEKVKPKRTSKRKTPAAKPKSKPKAKKAKTTKAKPKTKTKSAKEKKASTSTTTSYDEVMKKYLSSATIDDFKNLEPREMQEGLDLTAAVMYDEVKAIAVGTSATEKPLNVHNAVLAGLFKRLPDPNAYPGFLQVMAFPSRMVLVGSHGRVNVMFIVWGKELLGTEFISPGVERLCDDFIWTANPNPARLTTNKKFMMTLSKTMALLPTLHIMSYRDLPIVPDMVS